MSCFHSAKTLRAIIAGRDWVLRRNCGVFTEPLRCRSSTRAYSRAFGPLLRVRARTCRLGDASLAPWACGVLGELTNKQTNRHVYLYMLMNVYIYIYTQSNASRQLLVYLFACLLVAGLSGWLVCLLVCLLGWLAACFRGVLCKCVYVLFAYARPWKPQRKCD